MILPILIGLSMTGTMKDVNPHRGGLLYARVIKNNPRATKINCENAWVKAEGNCKPNMMIPVVDDCRDIKTSKELMKKKKLIFEYICTTADESL